MRVVAAGVTSRVWEIADLVALLGDGATGKKRGPYKKANGWSAEGEISK